MTVASLLLSTLQDILSGGARESIEVLFNKELTEGAADRFGAGCSLATSLDEVHWPLFPTAVLPLILSSTSNYIGVPVSSSTELGFGEVAPSTNALSLLARLAWSGTLRDAVYAASPAVKSWEKGVGSVCVEKLEKWIEAYKSEKTNVEEVRYFNSIVSHWVSY